MVLEDPALGSFRVQARILIFASDSADPGVELDTLPTLGTVVFKADYRAAKPLVHLASRVMVSPVTITASIRGDGRVVPPANGLAPVKGETLGVDPAPEVRLIAPRGNGLNVEDWTWTATVKPAAGQPWTEFTETLPPATPGELVILGGSTIPASAGVAQAITYPVASEADLPPEYRVGIDTYVLPDKIIYGTRNA